MALVATWNGRPEETLRTNLVRPLFDQFVGAREQGRRDFETERLGRLQIDHQLELGRRLHRQVRQPSVDDVVCTHQELSIDRQTDCARSF